MEKHFEKYTLKDFLTDEQFLQWKFFPSEESDNFWLGYIQEHPEKKNVINEALRILNTVTFNAPDIVDEEIKDIYDNILLCYDKYKNKGKVRRRLYTFTRYAAGIIIICLAIYGTYFASKKYGGFSTEGTKIQISSIAADTTSIKLYVGNKEFVYDEDADITFNEKNGKIQVSNNNETEYEAKLGKDIRTNKIVVPYGKRSTLLLPDGTKVYLNSGTTMIFPSKFTDVRSVNVEGEIYIEVQRDEKKPFIVSTNTFDVRVLGTTFNVSSYELDKTKSVVLVSGSVKISSRNSDKEDVLLLPNQMYSVTNGVAGVENVDVNKYILWIDGLYYFESAKLGDILARLSRYYGKNIIYNNTVAELRCTGKLDMKGDLPEILQGLTHTVPISYRQNTDGTHEITLNRK